MEILNYSSTLRNCLRWTFHLPQMWLQQKIIEKYLNGIFKQNILHVVKEKGGIGVFSKCYVPWFYLFALKIHILLYWFLSPVFVPQWNYNSNPCFKEEQEDTVWNHLPMIFFFIFITMSSTISFIFMTTFLPCDKDIFIWINPLYRQNKFS